MWHCSLAIFFSLMKTKLASLTEYLGFGDHILDVFIKKRKKNNCGEGKNSSWQRAKSRTCPSPSPPSHIWGL